MTNYKRSNKKIWYVTKSFRKNKINIIPDNIELYEQYNSIIDIKLLDQMLKYNAVDNKYIQIQKKIKLLKKQTKD